MTPKLETEFTSFLRDQDIPAKDNVSLREFSWFRTGGAARFIVMPRSIDEFTNTIRRLTEMGLPFKVIGETSNLMFLDDKRYSCLIDTRRINNISLNRADSLIEAEVGSLLPTLSRFALHNGLSGFAGLEGIPGTLGGGIFMNAGAYNYAIDQTLVKVDLVDRHGNMETLPASELGLSHRDSELKRGNLDRFVCKGYFRAKEGNQSEIYSEMEIFHAKRHKYLEYMYPNLGSLFVGSVFRTLGEKDLFYRIVSSAYMVINYRLKPFRRESPINRKWLNDFTIRKFGITYTKQPFSDKTINMLINNGHHTDEIVDYVNQLRKLLGDKVTIENEFVDPF